MGDGLEGESFVAGAGKHIWLLPTGYWLLATGFWLLAPEKRLPNRPVSSSLRAMSNSPLGFQPIIRLQKCQCQIAAASAGR
jgi:hypothetical protein